MDREYYLPYLLNYSQPVVEEIIIYCVAFLTAIIVSAEGQGLVATFLGDTKEGGNKDRLHFNVFMHLSLWGTINFFTAGFGWTKQVRINSANFKSRPFLKLMASRMAGPISNLLMANIAASLSWVLVKWGFDDQVFSSIVVVNVTMAFYNLIPVPPLPGSVFLSLFSGRASIQEKQLKVINITGAVVIVATFLIFRLAGFEGGANFFNPIVSAVTIFALDI